MKHRILVLSLTALLIVVAAGLYNHKVQAAKPVVVAAKDVSGVPSNKWFVEPNMREVGQEAASVMEAESRISRKAKLPDKDLAGGNPMIRTDEETLILIFPNDLVVTAVPWMWPGKDPRQYYADFVSSENANPSNQGPSSWPKNQLGGPAEPVNYGLIDISESPGYSAEKGHNLVEGKLDPRPAFVIWTKDGIEYRAFGAPDMPLAKLIPIAESVTNSK